MKNKDIEQKIQESVDDVEVRDFSLVWEDIKHEVQPTRRRRNMRWIPAVATIASAVIVCSVVIPIALQNGGGIDSDDSSSSFVPPTYWNSELSTVEVSAQEFFTQLSLAEIEVIDMSAYQIYSSFLSKTDEGVVKGGKVELTDDLENSTFYLSVRLYDESVQIEADKNITYDFDYSTNSATIEYRLKESYPDDGIYIYDIKANKSNVNYLMEYTCFSEDVTAFLDEFFK